MQFDQNSQSDKNIISFGSDQLYINQLCPKVQTSFTFSTSWVLNGRQIASTPKNILKLNFFDNMHLKYKYTKNWKI